MRTRHRRLRRLVDLWIDGETTADEAAVAADHVRRCWGCSAVVETTMLLKRALARTTSTDPVILAGARLRRFANELVRR